MPRNFSTKMNHLDRVLCEVFCKDLINLIKEFACPFILPWHNKISRSHRIDVEPKSSCLPNPADYLESWHETEFEIESNSYVSLHWYRVPKSPGDLDTMGRINCAMIQTPFCSSQDSKPAFELGLEPIEDYPHWNWLPFGSHNIRHWNHRKQKSYNWNLNGTLFPNISGDHLPLSLYTHQHLKLKVLFGWLNPSLEKLIGSKPIVIGQGFGSILEGQWQRIMMYVP